MEIHPRVMQSRLFTALTGAAMLVCSAWTRNEAFPGDRPSTFETQVGNGFSIVTEVDNPTPFIGEQFSVSYKLRASRPPLAVDVDPQQFTGFWTEPVAAAGDPEVTAGRSNRSETDYLLREVIAFPLSTGELSFPPLRLKIKAAGTPLRGAEDWDLICASEPVRIHVQPVPEDPASSFPLVGSVEGSFLTGGAERGHVLLELWGTANLELFDPTSLIRSSQATLLVAPVDDEKMVQTIESGGRRRIRLFLRRRWSIRSVIPRAGDLAVERFSVSVFQPQTGKWNTTAIPGIELPGFQMDIELPAEPGPVPPAARKSYPWRWPTIIALAALCASAWLIFGNPQLRLRSLFIRIFSRISRIRFSKP